MRIVRVRAHHLTAELSRTFSFSQASYSRRAAALVSVETDDGLTGWGEAYGPAAPAVAAIGLFAPMLTGRDPRDQEALWHLMFARTLDYGQKGVLVAAISAIDIALWDLKAQAAGVPLYRVLGGAETKSIACYATGFYPVEGESPEISFRREAETYASQGFRAMKVKVGWNVERDAALVRLVRETVGPGVRLMIDANHAFDPVSAIALARRIEDCGIFWFEEPVSPLDLEGYLRVKRATSIPLAGGECEYTRFGFEPLLRRRAVDFAQPDVCGCGGISEAMKIATIASVYNVHVTPHVWGTSIGQAAALHFYAARPRHPGSTRDEDKIIECDQSEHPFRTAIVEKPLRVIDGDWLLPDGPGLGLGRVDVSGFRKEDSS